MNELIRVLSDFSAQDFVNTVVFLILFFVASKWVYGQYKEIKGKIDERQRRYHEAMNAKEEEKEQLETRFRTIETHINDNNESIRKIEEQLKTIANNQKESMDIVNDIRIQSLRKQILNFTGKAVNLTGGNVSREDYAEIDRVYKDYERILKELGKENGFIDTSYALILKSFKDREDKKLFIEDLYIAPSNLLDKIKEAADE